MRPERIVNRYGTFTVLYYSVGERITTTCVGPSGPVPRFECTVGPTELTWTDQGVERYQVWRNNRVIEDHAVGTSLDIGGAGGDYKVKAAPSGHPRWIETTCQSAT